MDYEKKYKDLVEKLKKAASDHDWEDERFCCVINEHFSELKESEDESIRKAIHIYLDWLDGRKDYAPKGEYSIKDMIAWLEKQGELKPILDVEIPFGAKDSELIESTYFIPKGFHAEIIGDEVHIKQGEQNPFDYENVNIKQKDFAPKVEPKFHEGDWIIGNEGIFKITRYEDEYGYELIGTTGYVAHFISPDYLKSNCHLWTIQDAKDGDVLLFEGYYNSIVLFQGIGINGKGRINYHCKCDLGNYSFDIQCNLACLGTIEKDAEHYQPASKEQRDLLFKKMKEAGYEWDSDKKELKKVEE